MTPNGDTLLRAVDVTWPAARVIECGPWWLRQGLGGGQRVSAASANGTVDDSDIDAAIKGMAEMKQPPLFMIRPQDKALDALLDTRGFDIKDPVSTLIAPIEVLMDDLPSVSVTPSWPPLSVQREIWANAGIGPERIAVMERVTTVKTSHLGRSGDSPAGTAFTALDGTLAMLHALEVAPDHKRNGVGRNIMRGAANWAAARGATWMSVLVVNANHAANMFYQSLGLVNSGFGYHYRCAPKDAA